jgi:iron complex transport system substrate-binding protein/vitamin B12 transport system substrate-binding protein
MRPGVTAGGMRETRRAAWARILPAAQAVALTIALAGGLAGQAVAAIAAPPAAGGPPAVGESPATRPRLVTLAPSVTELVYAAGGGADIIGTVLNSDYPPAARAIPRIGDGIQYSDETILALRPTLVLAWQPTDATRALAARLGALGVPLLYADPRKLDDIPGLIRQLGARLGTQAAANAAASALQGRIDRLRPVPPPAPSVFIEVSADPLFTLGRDPLINDLLARCGGRNPYADSRLAAPQVSLESVLHLDPQVMILSPYGRDTLAARTRWWAQHGLAAAHQGRVYAIDPDWLHRPGPRLVDAAEAICADLRDSRSSGGGPEGR